MTCIVALEVDGDVIMACDSGESYAGRLMQEDNSKIFCVKDLMFGVSGYSRASNLLEHSLVLPENERESDMQYLSLDAAQAISECLNNGKLAKNDNGEEDSQTTILIGYKGKVYFMAQNYSVSRYSCGYFAIGSGADYALGAIHAMLESEQASEEWIALKAVEAACKFSDSCMEPMYMNTLVGEK